MYTEFFVGGNSDNRDMNSSLNRPRFELPENFQVRSFGLKSLELPYAWANVPTPAVLTLTVTFGGEATQTYTATLPAGEYTINTFLKATQASFSGLPALGNTVLSLLNIIPDTTPVPVGYDDEPTGRARFEFPPAMWGASAGDVRSIRLTYGAQWKTLVQFPYSDRAEQDPWHEKAAADGGASPTFMLTPWTMRFLPSHLYLHSTLMRNTFYGSTRRPAGGFKSQTIMAKIAIPDGLTWNQSQVVYGNLSLSPDFLFTTSPVTDVNRMEFWVTDEHYNEIDFLGNYFSLTLAFVV